MRLTQIVVLTLLTLSYATAEIITDGSLGAKVELSGKDFQITPELGQQFGGNLFHSFQTFNLNADEAATFSGATSVQNVIARVTGGNPSQINGLIRSTIPNADLYLMNPYGVMFGQNVKLDLQGGFHVSTADYLKLQDGGRFDARNPNNSLLSVAPVAAFGFLTEAPAPIIMQNSKLSLSEDKTFSLIGGNLRLTGNQPYTSNETGELKFNLELLAPNGRFNLASVSSSGEVTPVGEDIELNLSEVAQRGHITFQNALVTNRGTIVDSHNNAGTIFIRGGQFELMGSAVSSQTKSNGNGGTIDIRVGTLKVQQGSLISASTFGIGKAGSINIESDTVEISGKHEIGESSSISSHSNNADSGDAGKIQIEARKISLSNGGLITTGTLGTGSGGAIILNAINSLDLSGAYIAADSNGKQQVTGNAGNITLHAGQISLVDGAQINAATYGGGQGGTINLQVSDALAITGQDTKGNLSSINAISSNKELKKAGNAGNIEIVARQVKLSNGGELASNTIGTGQGGSITLNVTGDLTLSEAYIAANSNSTESKAGNAGNLTIQAAQVSLTDGAQINSATRGGGHGGAIHLQVSDTLTVTGKDTKGIRSGISTASGNEELEKAGNSGSLEIRAHQIVLTNGAKLDSSTYGTGQGGSVILKGVDTLTVSGSLDNGTFSQIMATSNNKELTHAGDAGNIEIEARQINLTENGQIGSATRGSGQGGKVILRGVDTLTSTGERSGISSNSLGSKGNAGDAGNVSIKAGQIILADGGQIASQTSGTGQGGTITLDVANNLTLSDGSIAANSNSKQQVAGNAGNITIRAGQILLSDGAQINTLTRGGGLGGTIDIQAQNSLTISGKSKDNYISGINSNSESSNSFAGQAGTISVIAKALHLQDSGKISTTTNNASGGDIKLTPYLLNLQRGMITSTVKGGKGDGGNITVTDARFITLNQGVIKAEADEGHGGNIRITAQHFIPSIGSLVSASSNLGIDGQITIQSPANDIGNQVLSLSTNFTNAAGLLPRSCAAKIADQRPSQFVRPFTLTMKPRATGATPEDLQASQLQSHR